MITYLELGNYGRLGNQMFQVASTIGIAYKNECNWCFPKWDHPFNDTFLELPEQIKEVFGTRKIPWGYYNIILDGQLPINLHGYLQSEKYFKHCEKEIRKKFTFKEQLQPINDFIAVHVRRGDYDPKYHTLLGIDYYRQALSSLPALPIYLFTDDPSEAIKAVPRYDQLFYSNAFYDLNLMTRAKYHVIANSSFSWWGAWLSNSEKIIAPKQWFGPLQPLSTKDLIPENWIQI